MPGSRHAARRRRSWQDIAILFAAAAVMALPMTAQQLAGYLAGPPPGAGPACGGRVQFYFPDGWQCPPSTFATSPGDR